MIYSRVVNGVGQKPMKPATWKCAVCGGSFTWVPRYEVYLDYITDRAPWVVTLSDGKEYGFCSRECARLKAVLVALEVMVSRKEKA